MKQQDPFFSSVFVKLFLYISIAVLSSLLTDLSYFTCPHEDLKAINTVRWITIVLNALMQGFIAWRAFIDGSSDKYTSFINHHHTSEIKRHVASKKKSYKLK